MQDKISVLVVDDDEDDFVMTRDLLEEVSPGRYQLTWVSTFEDGLGRLLSAVDDACLVDFRLGEYTGIDLIEKANQAHCTVPCILLTGQGRREIDLQAMHSGAYDYLDKLSLSGPLLERSIRYAVEAAETRQKLALSDLVFASASECIVLADGAQRILAVNPAYCHTTGYSAEEAIGEGTKLLASGQHDAPFYQEMWATIARDGEWRGELWDRRKNGELFPAAMHIRAVPGGDGRASHFVAIFNDISASQAVRKQIEQLTYFDSLTQLPNRILAMDRLRQMLSRGERDGSITTVMIVSLNHIDSLSQNLGFHAGDTVIREIANRLKKTVRGDETLARFGAKEFLIVANQWEEEGEAIRLAERITAAVSEPIAISDHSLYSVAHIGISLSSRDGTDPEALLRKAQAVASHLRRQGESTYRFYSNELSAHATETLLLESALRTALAQEQFVVFYQPQVNLRTGQIDGAEALVRWKHPDRGLIPPNDFIPSAERTGLIEPIGEWVLRTACAQCKAWHAAGHEQLRISVNLSARQFRAHDLADRVRRALTETELDSRYLELELTETMVIEDPDETVQILNDLRKDGIAFSLDDFGTGYSSLNQLKRFPIETLKIDQSFVRELTTDPDSAAIALSTISLAQAMHRSVIAEGVETEAQAAFLLRNGCERIQGYWISRPVPANEFDALLDRSFALEATRDVPARTVLMVDDEPSILSALRRLFRRQDFSLLLAASAKEAFELLAKHPVQVILADQRMPDMTGTEFLAKVRDLHPATVRLVLSGYADFETIANAVNEGAIFKFLSKPWEEDHLIAQIREAFRYHDMMTGGATNLIAGHETPTTVKG